MAKDDVNTGLYLVAMVGIVAVIGLVVLVMNSGSSGTYSYDYGDLTGEARAALRYATQSEDQTNELYSFECKEYEFHEIDNAIENNLYKYEESINENAYLATKDVIELDFGEYDVIVHDALGYVFKYIDHNYAYDDFFDGLAYCPEECDVFMGTVTCPDGTFPYTSTCGLEDFEISMTGQGTDFLDHVLFPSRPDPDIDRIYLYPVIPTEDYFGGSDYYSGPDFQYLTSQDRKTYFIGKAQNNEIMFTYSFNDFKATLDNYEVEGSGIIEIATSVDVDFGFESYAFSQRERKYIADKDFIEKVVYFNPGSKVFARMYFDELKIKKPGLPWKDLVEPLEDGSYYNLGFDFLETYSPHPSDFITDQASLASISELDIIKDDFTDLLYDAFYEVGSQDFEMFSLRNPYIQSLDEGAKTITICAGALSATAAYDTSLRDDGTDVAMADLPEDTSPTATSPSTFGGIGR